MGEVASNFYTYIIIKLMYAFWTTLVAVHFYNIWSFGHNTSLSIFIKKIKLYDCSNNVQAFGKIRCPISYNIEVIIIVLGYNLECAPNRAENPHKYLLCKPSPNQIFVYLASACSDLPPNGALLLYLSADGMLVQPPKHPSEDGKLNIFIATHPVYKGSFKPDLDLQNQ